MAGPERLGRHASLETLESRQLLSLTLPAIADQTVSAGAPLNLAINGSESSGHALTYAVSVSNSTLVTSSGASATLTTTVPTGNPSLVLTVADAADGINGTLVLQLFQDLAPETVEKIVTMVNGGYYDGLTFHRIVKDFMIQGGDPVGDGTGGPGYTFDDELNSSLQFTSGGVLAMANNGSDTNGSQFFITAEATRWLDFRYTIFGMLTKGSDVLQKIESVPVHTNSTGEESAPDNSVVISSAAIVTDNENAVLRLSTANGVTGAADVTVTVTDSVTGETASKTFHVTSSADTTNDPPYLNDITPITTNANMPVGFDIPTTDVEGDAIKYSAIASDTSKLTVIVDSTTGHVTVTPNSGIVGVYSIQVGVEARNASSSDSIAWDTQNVPVYVNPAAPSSVGLVSTSDTGTSSSDHVTSLDNNLGKTLQFAVEGVTSGALIQLYADGTLIGNANATATGTSVTITTDGTVPLTDGIHAITATQTLANQTVDVGNLKTTVDLTSASSASLAVTVDTTQPQFAFTPAVTAVAQVAYTCQIMATNSSGGALTYGLNQPLTGMTIDAATGWIHWTPTTGQIGTVNVIAQATDVAGNTAQRQFTVTVLAANAAPVLVSASPLLGSTDGNTPVAVQLNTFINNNTGTTTITDANDGAVIGGIALIGRTGNGTWTYSLDGTGTFTAVGSVSGSSALLLPATAKLKYQPDGSTAETATIVYRAWDATSGTAGQVADTTLNGAVTAFSTATDTASLSVTATATGSISGYAYVDANNDGLRTTSSGATHLGIQGVVITLYIKEGSVWTNLGSTMTASDGSYHSTGLAAGTYKIVETQPTKYLDGKETLGTVDGKMSGTAGGDLFTGVVLAQGSSAVGYNFGERGLDIAKISLPLFLASCHSSITAAEIATPPVVRLSSSTSDGSYSTSYTTASSAVAIADSGATVTHSDSAWLARMVATLSGILDDDHEALAATTTGTSITASYSSGVLTLSGVDSVDNYRAVLKTIKYSDTASSPTPGTRTVLVVVNDGVVDSDSATATVSLAAIDAALVNTENWLSVQGLESVIETER